MDRGVQSFMVGGHSWVILPRSPPRLRDAWPSTPPEAAVPARCRLRPSKPRPRYRGPGRFDLRSNGGANRDRTGDLLLAKRDRTPVDFASLPCTSALSRSQADLRTLADLAHFGWV